MTDKQQPPERIWLPADTDSDSWNVLAKNPSRDWRTGGPANNIEYARVRPVDDVRVEEIRERWSRKEIPEQLFSSHVKERH